MPAARRDFGNTSALNCGLWRERGMVRISMTCLTPCASSRRMNSSMGRFEWPIVNIRRELRFGAAVFFVARFFLASGIIQCILAALSARAAEFDRIVA